MDRSHCRPTYDFIVICVDALKGASDLMQHTQPITKMERMTSPHLKSSGTEVAPNVAPSSTMQEVWVRTQYPKSIKPIIQLWEKCKESFYLFLVAVGWLKINALHLHPVEQNLVVLLAGDG